MDDDREKIGRRISGVKVQGSTYEIPEICEKFDIEVILFSIYSISPEDKKRILDICAKTNVEVRIVPSIYDLVTANLSMEKKIRRVEVEDLLGREPVVFDTRKYGKYLHNQTVLVTGGGGSIGSELCRQIAELAPKNLIILDIYENNAYNIQQELRRTHGDCLNFEVQIASVRDRDKLDLLFAEKHIDVVFHAAAHKHVPLMEANPEEAVKNNVFGTPQPHSAGRPVSRQKICPDLHGQGGQSDQRHGGDQAHLRDAGAKHGQTKRHRVRHRALRQRARLQRLGHSAVPAADQNGGPVTVTHPDIIRYFMTIPEAVSLVLTAGGLAAGGEIFILDMGEPVKIKDLAENLIRLSGLVPGKDIQIEYTGLRRERSSMKSFSWTRKGSKAPKTKIHIKPIDLDADRLSEELRITVRDAGAQRQKKVVAMLAKIVPTYKRTTNGHDAFCGK